MSIESRLGRLEKSPGLTPRPVAVFYQYGEPVPEPPAGCSPVTLVCELVVERDEATGELVTEDPWGGPPIRFRDNAELPDRDPRNKP